MALHQQPGPANEVVQRAVRRLRNAWHNSAAIPAADRTDDAHTVALRYFEQAYPDDWVLEEGHADKHLDGDEPAELEIQDILAALAPGRDPLQAVIDIVRSADPGDVTADRQSNRPLRIKFAVELGKRARLEANLNPKGHHSIAGTIFRSDYIRIAIHHIGPGYGVN